MFFWSGGAVFFIGGGLLYEIEHKNFLLSEASGIFGGILLVLLGGVIGSFVGSARE
jgi:hypothetical protein